MTTFQTVTAPKTSTFQFRINPQVREQVEVVQEGLTLLVGFHWWWCKRV